MSQYAFRLYCDTLAAKTEFEGGLVAANRILYVKDGSATLRSAGQVMTLAPNSAWCARSACQLIAGASGAQLLRWELQRPDSPAAAEGAQSRLLLESELNLSAPDGFLFRCDRVDFPPGGIAYTHTHQGPGIRCLLKGQFAVETAGHSMAIVPGGAWFESGPDPVLATAWDQSPTGFVRVMVLPRSLKGTSSIKYVKAEDLQKPKPQQYQIFIDEFIDL
jgi:quercetin dioxygenase-like cupin family protein